MPSSTSGSRPLVALIALALVIAGAWFVMNGSGRDPAPGTDSPSVPSSPNAAAKEAASVALERQAATPSSPEKSAPPAGSKPAAPSDAAEPSAATVTGHVFDARGLPIVAATVAHLSANQSSPIMIGLPADVLAKTTTDRDGAFRIELPALGPFTLRASHPGHPATEYRGKAQSPRIDDVRIVLRDGASIRGRVTGAPADASTITVMARALDSVAESVARAPMNSPLNSLIDVSTLLEGLAVPVGAEQVLAAADGTFELVGLDPDRRYRLCAAEQIAGNAMLQRCTASVEVGAGASGVELPWREPFSLTLRVLDADTGNPIEELDVAAGPVQQMKVFGATIPVPMLQPLDQHRFAGGNVTIRGMAIDPAQQVNFGVRIEAHGRLTWSRDDIAPAPQGLTDLGIIRLTSAPIVRVRVTHRGEPVAGAEVHLEQVRDPNDGSAAHGKHSISISNTMHDPDSPAAEVARTQQTETHDRNLTTAEGICEVTADFDGSCRVLVDSDSFARHRGEPFQLPARGVCEQPVELVRGGIAHVLARNGHGDPLPGVTIERTGQEGDHGSQPTDAGGRTTFEHLAPGSHTFNIARPQRGGSAHLGIVIDGQSTADGGTRATVPFTDEQVQDVLLQEPLRGTLQGTVTLDNEPLDRAEVRLAARSTGDAQHEAANELGAAVEGMLGGLLGGAAGSRGKTDSDGLYRLDDVPAGDYRLVVTGRRLAMPASVDVHLNEGENVQDLALRATTLRGRVLDAAGQPLAGATVTATVYHDDDPAAIADATSTIGDFFGTSLQNGVRSDADGSFELRGVRAAVPLRIRAEAKMHVARSLRVEALTEGERREGVAVQLTAAGRVRVHVNLAGAVAVSASWAGTGDGPPDASTRSAVLRNGRATLDGLHPGRWRLTLDGSDTAKATQQQVEVLAGQTADIEF